MNFTEARVGVGVPLPIQNLGEFTTFDESLKIKEKKNALVMLE